MTDPRRYAAWRRGKRAENVAIWWLRLKGYRILARNVRSMGAEIDLIVRRGRRLAAVEVKARPTYARAASALGGAQQARILRALAGFVQRHPKHSHCEICCDVVLVVPRHWPRHLRDAWRES